MAQATTRVYHPSLNTWYDVTNPEEWVESGWRKSKPAHVDDSADPKPAAVERAARATRSGRKARSRQQEAAAAVSQPKE